MDFSLTFTLLVPIYSQTFLGGSSTILYLPATIFYSLPLSLTFLSGIYNSFLVIYLATHYIHLSITLNFMVFFRSSPIIFVWCFELKYQVQYYWWANTEWDLKLISFFIKAKISLSSHSRELNSIFYSHHKLRQLFYSDWPLARLSFCGIPIFIRFCWTILIILFGFDDSFFLSSFFNF